MTPPVSLPRRRAGCGRPADDRGAATLLVVSMLGLLLLVGCALGVAGAMVAAHRRAQAAADLAALAGAQAVASARDPCAEAGSVAVADGAVLASCEVLGREVLVEVSVAGPRWLGQAHDLPARARAGPGP